MKQKGIVFLLAAVLVLLLVGASFLYKNLREDNTPDQLAVKSDIVSAPVSEI